MSAVSPPVVSRDAHPVGALGHELALARAIALLVPDRKFRAKIGALM
ncbi:MAG: hypothetical protein EBE86_020350 [Hormoscilla sp. GUM202]|nr:hypothetical protein [Hormoscilla sp. GUM202]